MAFQNFAYLTLTFVIVQVGVFCAKSVQSICLCGKNPSKRFCKIAKVKAGRFDCNRKKPLRFLTADHSEKERLVLAFTHGFNFNV